MTQSFSVRLPSSILLSSLTSFRQGLLGLWVLNVADALFTLHWIREGKAVEANPMMAMALAHGPEWFLLSKFALVSLGAFILWRHAEQKMVLLATPVMLLYSLVVGIHLAESIAL